MLLGEWGSLFFIFLFSKLFGSESGFIGKITLTYSKISDEKDIYFLIQTMSSFNKSLNNITCI